MIRPLYKAHEPFMEVPTGHGFQGVIMYDDKEDKIQCHLCGKWFAFLTPHLNREHRKTADDYRLAFGLPMRIGLCGAAVSRQRSVNARHLIAENKGFSASAGKLSKNFHKKRRYKRKPGSLHAASVNRVGLCLLQMKARYEVVAHTVGHYPTKAEIKQYDPRLERAMVRRHGGLNGFRKVHGLPLRYKRPVIHTEIVIAAFLRNLSRELQRKPRSVDILPGEAVSRQTIYNKFGSWEAALQYAGIR